MTKFSESEVSRLLTHVTILLQEDDSLADRIPLLPETLMEQLRDGVVLCKLVNILAPGVIPARKIREDFSDERKRHFYMLENQSQVLKAALRMNCMLVNVSAGDLVAGKANLVLGLFWQIIKNGMMMKLGSKYSSRSSTKLDLRSVEDEQAENSLLRWINTTVVEGDNDVRASDMKRSLSDGLVYGKLIATLYPHMLDCEEFLTFDNVTRAKAIVTAGRSILGAKCILEVEDILKGNETMNTLFLATLCRHVTEELSSIFITTPILSRSCSVVEMESPLGEEIMDFESRISELQRENQELKERLILFENSNLNQSVLDEFDVEADKISMLDDEELLAEDNEDTLILPNDDIEEALVDDNLSIASEDADEDDEDPEGELLSLDVAEDDLCIPSENVDEEDHEVEAPSLDIAEEVDPMEEAVESQSIDQISEVDHEKYQQISQRLRKIYLGIHDMIDLVLVIYGKDLSYPTISSTCTKCGPITKKNVNKAKWNPRWVVIKDNFCFFYKSESSTMPTSVENLDDCKVTKASNKCGRLTDPVLAIEIASLANPHNLYITAPEAGLEEWKQVIIRTSAYWH